MLTKEAIRDISDLASNCKLTNRTKAILNYQFTNGTALDVVLKVSSREQGKFMYAVYRRLGGNWNCLESGFHADLGYIQSYLLERYLSQDELVNRNVIAYAR